MNYKKVVLKVVLLGARGQLGYVLGGILSGNCKIQLFSPDLDICDHDAMEQYLTQVQPDWVINCAAYTNVAQCDVDLAFAVNAIAVGKLGQICQRLGIKVIHYSTDYVFSGAQKHPYIETDQPDPINSYGASKLAGEQLLQASGCNAWLIRTSWLIGMTGINFFTKLENQSQTKSTIQVVNDQYGVPTSAVFLGQVSASLLDLPVDCTGFKIMHVVPNGIASWFDLALWWKKQTNAKVEIEAINTINTANTVLRPSYSVLDNKYMQSLLGKPPSWQSALLLRL